MTGEEWIAERSRETERERQVDELRPLVAKATYLFLKHKLAGLSSDEKQMEGNRVCNRKFNIKDWHQTVDDWHQPDDNGYDDGKSEERKLDWHQIDRQHDWQQEAFSFLFTKSGLRVLENADRGIDSKGNRIENRGWYIRSAICKHLRKTLAQQYQLNFQNNSRLRPSIVSGPPDEIDKKWSKKFSTCSGTDTLLLEDLSEGIRNQILAKPGECPLSSGKARGLRGAGKKGRSVKAWARSQYPHKEAQLLLKRGSDSEKVKAIAYRVMRTIHLKHKRLTPGQSVLFEPSDGGWMLWGPMAKTVSAALGRKEMAGAEMIGLEPKDREVVDILDPKLVRYAKFSFKEIANTVSRLEKALQKALGTFNQQQESGLTILKLAADGMEKVTEAYATFEKDTKASVNAQGEVTKPSNATKLEKTMTRNRSRLADLEKIPSAIDPLLSNLTIEVAEAVIRGGSQAAEKLLEAIESSTCDEPKAKPKKRKKT
ncbi:hypothetical protein [Gemmata massiliana]|nr:hypothetical protein [Gemmata massiliana]